MKISQDIGIVTKTVLPWPSGIMAIIFYSKLNKDNNTTEESFIFKKWLYWKDSFQESLILKKSVNNYVQGSFYCLRQPKA